MGCESKAEINRLKENVQEEMRDDFIIEETKKKKPKIKIINIEEDKKPN